MTTLSALETDTETAIDALRAYLDRVGFHEIYKFLVGVNRYGVAPSIINRASAGGIERFFDSVLDGRPELRLLQCFLADGRAQRRDLAEEDVHTADLLANAGLLERSGQGFSPGPWQLISAFGLNLLVDRRIHFGEGVHEVYIGVDSYLMLFYIDAARVQPHHRVLDLCTGTGISALYLSRFSGQVVATDISLVALSLTQLNRRLNGSEPRLSIRDQPLEETLAGGEKFDLLTCNPPFVAYPPGVKASLYSQGTDIDGLGYMRQLIQSLDTVLNPGGSAYLVADLVGDRHGPHFVAELEELAAREGLSIDVYIDNVLPASVQVEPLVGHLVGLDRDQSRERLTSELEAFQRDTLRAERYYLSTLKLRTRATAPGMRVLRRYELPPERTRRWPKILRTE